MSRILIHSLVFSPDGVSTAYLYNDIAVKFKESGFEVVVLSTTPHYNVIPEDLQKQVLHKRAGGLFYTSVYQGIKVYHIPQKKFKNALLRMAGFLYWHIASIFLALSLKKINLILSPSPPLTIGFINLLIGKLKGSKVIYNVQEIYPDLLIESGGLKSKSIISILKKLESLVYNHSDKVTTIDKIFYDTIIARFKEQTKLSIIPNFVDTSIYKPIGSSLKNLSPYFPTTDSLKVMYAGNVGIAQDWNPLIKLAIELKDEKIEFFIIGEGVMKTYLENEITKHNLSKVHLIPYQSRELMPSLIAYSDLQFIFMSPLTEGHGFPSKVYTIMACGKPLLVCSGANTPIVNFLQDKHCAILITEKDDELKIDQLAKALTSNSRESLASMGLNGISYIEQNYSKETVTSQYVELAKSLIN